MHPLIPALEHHRILPVAVLENPADALPLAHALRSAGLPLVEITLRTPGALEAVASLRHHCPDILVGVGTLLHPGQVREALDAGAQFGLSAGFQESVVREARAQGLPFVPGVMTPSDIEAALAEDCRLLKFFPASCAGGLPMLRALSGPYAHTGIQFIPLGGIGPENLCAYLALPLVAGIGGTWICDPQLIRSKNWGEITRLGLEARNLATPKAPPL
ncbi:MAG: bifunctional 4-hydroxy-2-oxoglutarate aldolase/2-dehydro-3-deoxy-phosphogluconate aldolase [Verrucomicrobiota bacterium]|jgi:2-dehydro-3-deoxyphosphogluconate aldolase/(4S)-4-hydroxy-2-oxoglutarate aldolase